MITDIEDGLLIEGERLKTTDSLDGSIFDTVIFPQLDVQPDKSDAEYAIMIKRLFGWEKLYRARMDHTLFCLLTGCSSFLNQDICSSQFLTCFVVKVLDLSSLIYFYNYFENIFNFSSSFI